jgi:hypothetical protein
MSKVFAIFLMLFTLIFKNNEAKAIEYMPQPESIPESFLIKNESIDKSVAIKIVNQLVKSEDIKIDDYLKPTVIKSDDGRWLFLFINKAEDSVGNHFSVSINPKDKTYYFGLGR